MRSNWPKLSGLAQKTTLKLLSVVCVCSLLSRVILVIKFELVHDKTYNKTCATSQGSDQLHIHAVGSVFADGMCLLDSRLSKEG